MPISYYTAGALLQFMFVAGARFSYRGLRIVNDYFTGNSKAKIKRVMIIGAGDAGRMVLRELKVERPVTSRVVCLVDDNPDKAGRMHDNVEIKGNRNDIPALVDKYKIEEIVLAIPTACVALFFALGVRDMAAQVTLLQEACPCAAITSVFAVQFHHDEGFAGGLVVVSTLLSIVTLPVCALLLTM